MIFASWGRHMSTHSWFLQLANIEWSALRENLTRGTTGSTQGGPFHLSNAFLKQKKNKQKKKHHSTYNKATPSVCSTRADIVVCTLKEQTLFTCFSLPNWFFSKTKIKIYNSISVFQRGTKRIDQRGHPLSLQQFLIVKKKEGRPFGFVCWGDGDVYTSQIERGVLEREILWKESREKNPESKNSGFFCYALMGFLCVYSI